MRFFEWASWTLAVGVLSAMVCGASCLSSCDGVGAIGSMRQGGMQHGAARGDMSPPVDDGEAAATPALFPFEADCAYVYDGADVDGDATYNAAYTTGDKLTTWVNRGTATGDDATNASSTYRPTVCTDCAGGNGAVSFDGVADLLYAAGSIDGASFMSNTAAFEAFVITRVDTHRPRTIVGNTNTSTRKGFALHQSHSSNYESHRFFITSGSASNLNFTSTADLTPGGFEVINSHANGVAANSYQASIALAWSSYESGTISGTLHVGDMTEGLSLGQNISSTSNETSYDGEVAFVALCSGEMSAPDRAAALAWAEGRYGATWTNLDAAQSISALGDSLTATARTRADVGWTHLLDIQEGPTVSVGNNGTGGAVLSGCQTEWTNLIDNDGFDVLLMWCGGNDIRAGTAAATAFTAWEAIVDDALAQGMTVIGMTFPPYGNYVGWSAPQQVELDSINASILAKTGAGYVTLDMYALLEDDVTPDDLEASCDTGDGLHINSACQQTIATAIAAVLP